MKETTLKTIYTKKLMDIAIELHRIDESSDNLHVSIAKHASSEIIQIVADLRDDEFITPKEMAELIKTSPNVLNNWRIAKKHYPYYKIESKIYYKKQEVLSIINSSKVDI